MKNESLDIYKRCIKVNLRVPVCPLSCSFKSTGTLIFISAITGTGALATAFLKTLNTTDEWVKMSQKFKEHWNFPNGLGGVDCKHIVLQQPKSCSLHYSGFSMNILHMGNKSLVQERFSKIVQAIYCLP